MENTERKMATKKKIRRLAYALIELHEDDLVRVFEEIAEMTNTYKVDQMLMGTTKGLKQDKYNMIAFDNWMERQFKKDMSQKPTKVAFLCKKSMGIKEKIMPLLVRLAQKVKRRLYMRNRRKREE